MKLYKIALANASAILTVTVYLFCSLAVAILPDLSKVIAESWFHGIDLGKIWVSAPRGNFVLGLTTAGAGAWVTGWFFAVVYNRLAK